MLLNQNDIDEFRKIYSKDSGESITDDEAREMAARLITLYEVLAEPLSSEHGQSRVRPDIS